MGKAAVLLLLLLGCATPPPSSAGKPRAGIEEARQLFTAALLVGDGNRVATLYADDGTILPPSLPGLIRGHAAIADYWRDRLKTTRFLDLQFSSVELVVYGDLAWEVGTLKYTTQSQDAAPVSHTGRALLVWRQTTDGRWRIQADAALSDPPPR
jgi:uncharacterized protein (TIGR02246 family)